MDSTTAVIIPPKLTEEQIEFYNREGYLVLPGLLNADAADAVRGDITTI
ncbi:MAG: hypothetical protein H7145_07580, partial [Akkermansiaceae bacterium]|nr:hypothetical protein [Armatimonadota bacterium]